LLRTVSDKIYIFDEIVVQEPRSSELSQAYIRQYAPAARSRGMTLEAAWRSPALKLEGRTSTLHFLWSVPNVGGWWQMRLGAARANPELDVAMEGEDDKTTWWRFVDIIAQSRKRTFMVDLAQTNSDV
jgi:hypothetical protein